MVQQEREGLNTKLSELIDLMKQEQIEKNIKKTKKVKTNSFFKAKSKNKLKQGYVTVWHLRNNGQIDAEAVRINNELTYDKKNATYHEGNIKDVLWFGNKPVIIQPEWSIQPFSARTHKELIENNGLSADAQKVYINAMEMSLNAIKGKFGMDGRKWFIIIGGIIVVVYLLNEFLNKGGI